MATSTTEKNEKREDLFVSKGYANDDPNQFIGVNGVNYILPKGKTSNVPSHIANEYHRSQRAQQKQDENADALQQQPSA